MTTAAASRSKRRASSCSRTAGDRSLWRDQRQGRRLRLISYRYITSFASCNTAGCPDAHHAVSKLRPPLSPTRVDDSGGQPWQRDGETYCRCCGRRSCRRRRCRCRAWHTGCRWWRRAGLPSAACCRHRTPRKTRCGSTHPACRSSRYQTRCRGFVHADHRQRVLLAGQRRAIAVLDLMEAAVALAVAGCALLWRLAGANHAGQDGMQLPAAPPQVSPATRSGWQTSATHCSPLSQILRVAQDSPCLGSAVAGAAGRSGRRGHALQRVTLPAIATGCTDGSLAGISALTGQDAA